MGENTSFCGAMSNRGDPLTVYAHGRANLVIAKKPGELVCTQDPGHERSHAACDGAGHILARWPRSSVERYWQPGDCEGHDHG
jgi:hypothetical protein